MASLTIYSSPSDCTVKVNGKNGGAIDLKGSIFVLKPGFYTVTLQKPGYQSATKTINLSAGQSEALNFELTPTPGTLVLTTNTSGAQIEVSNVGSYTDRINNLSLPPGTYHVKASKAGYRTTERDLLIKTGETTTVPLTLEAVPIEETLAEAEIAYNNKNFAQVFALCNQVLAVKPDSPKAYLLLGLSYYSQGQYGEGVNFLVRAIAFGGQVRLNIRHRHYVFLSGEDLCLGFLTLDREKLSFTSTNRSGHDFTIPLSKINELKVSPLGGWRLSMKLLVPKKNGKEDKKEYDFYVSRAGTKQVLIQGSKYPTSQIYCENCQAEIQALQQLIGQAKLGPDKAQPGPPALKRVRSERTLESEPKIGPVAEPAQALWEFSKDSLGLCLPVNWYNVPESNSAWFAPEGGYGKVQGQMVFTHGVNVGFAQNQIKDLKSATDGFINTFIATSKNLKRQAVVEGLSIAGRPALLTSLENINEATSQTERILVYTALGLNSRLFYMICVAPQNEFTDKYARLFERIVRSIKLKE
jgi:hypothetical protein